MPVKRLPRALAALVLGTAAMTALSGCVVLPVFVYEMQPDPIITEPPPEPTTPPNPEAPPGGTDEADPIETADPGTVPIAPDELGELLDGAELYSPSALDHDAPADVSVQPTYGQATPWIDQLNPYGDHSQGRPFMQNTQPGSVAHLMQSTIGRIYAGTEQGFLSSCSGTVVSSESGSVIVSAGHCFWDFERSRTWEQILFVPGDRDNGITSPWGIWDVAEVFYPTQFVEGAHVDEQGRTLGPGWPYDFAFAVIEPDASGRTIQSLTGGQGITFAQRYSGVLMVGYPSNDPFDGSLPRYCSATTANFGNLYWPHVTARCDQTGGSSGSSWVTGADPNSGAGFVTAVTSTGNAYSTAEPPWMQSGALLGEIALELYRAADAA